MSQLEQARRIGIGFPDQLEPELAPGKPGLFRPAWCSVLHNFIHTANFLKLIDNNLEIFSTKLMAVFSMVER